MDEKSIRRIMFVAVLLSLMQINFKELSGSSYFSLDYYKNLMNKATTHVKKNKKYYIMGAVVIGGVLLYQNKEWIESQYQDFFAKKENKTEAPQDENPPLDDKENPKNTNVLNDKELKNQENLNAGMASSENKVPSGSETRDAKGAFFYGGKFVEKGADPFLFNQIPDEDLTTIKVLKDTPPIRSKDNYYPRKKIRNLKR